VASEPVRIGERIKFGEDCELDPISYELRRSGRVLKLERIPTEILLFLVEQRGKLVSREQIVDQIWGKGVFLDTDNSINGAIRKIRQVLKDDPEQPRFIQTVTGKGYRFIAPVVARNEPGLSTVPLSVPLRGIQTKKSTSSKWRVAVGIAVLLVVAGSVAYFRWSRSLRRPPLPGGRVLLAVLPFENLTGDARQDYASDGLTEEMISQLGDLDPQRLGVIARTSVMFYKHNPKPLDQVGRELGVQYVLEGSVRRDSDRVRISAQLIQIKDQTHVWARQYDRELKDLLAVQAEIAEEIAGEIQLALGGQHKLSATHRTVSASTSYEAYDLYLKGLYFWNKRTGEGFHQAADYFQQALAKDPNYARAYAGLADTFGLMSTWTGSPPNEFMPKARAAAMKALELDEGLAEAHTALAFVAEGYDHDWQTADKEFRQAIDLDPGYATAHQWYAEYLSWMGRFDEALSESEQARKLDPLSLIIASDRGAVLYRARQYDRAIAQFRAVLDMDPHFAHPHGYLLISYIRAGRFTDALDEINRYTRPLSHAWAAAEEAIVYGEWGRTAEAEQALAKFEKYAQKSPPDPYARLPVYIGTGQKDQAMALLQKAFAERSPLISNLKTDPAYDPLRSDQRFQDLLRRVGLAQ
jgi:TolB-like protein/DNA-binding winged helix-turn-helix (wHTH) protein/Tfp pilus assembly protein PilF